MVPKGSLFGSLGVFVSEVLFEGNDEFGGDGATVLLRDGADFVHDLLGQADGEHLGLVAVASSLASHAANCKGR